MKQTLKYVGLDVHQATTVTAVLEESGRVIARSVVPTEATAIVEFVRGTRGAVHVALEEGTQAQWLHDLLAPVVTEVVVCDRRGQGSHGSRPIMRTPSSWPSCCARVPYAPCITGPPSARR